MRYINQQKIEIMNHAPKGKTPTTEATANAIRYQLENAQPTLKTSDYYTLYLGHSYKMPTQRTFMTLDFWISFIGEKEANEHLDIITKTNEAFKIFAMCEDSFLTEIATERLKQAEQEIKRLQILTKNKTNY